MTILLLCTSLISISSIAVLKSFIDKVNLGYTQFQISQNLDSNSTGNSFVNSLVAMNLIGRISIIAIIVVTIISLFICLRISHNYALTDSITGLRNATGVNEYLTKLCKKGIQNKYNSFAINIKGFNFINKKYGNVAGAYIIQKYSEILWNFLENDEIAGRTGGDDFFVVLKRERTEEFLMMLATIKIPAEVIDKNNQKTEIKNVNVDSRCGIYVIQADDEPGRIKISSATALKSAKNTPLGEFVIFREDMMEIVMNEKETLSLFPGAIKNHEFKVLYQPKVDLQTCNLCGCEALVRWVRDGKLVAPDNFIPILEKNGIVTELDYYVFEQVCHDLKLWKQQGKTPVKVSSNFSKLHLADPEFGKRIIDILTKYDVDPKLIEIELTESCGYDDLEALKEFVGIMNEHHISTSIDDFGTGYSSLSLIKELDVDVIKLDKSLINHIDEGDTKNEIMIKNIVTMIKDLGRDVICEGVETTNQAKYLKSVNCNVVQGFLCDKPLSHDEFEKKLEKPVYNIS